MNTLKLAILIFIAGLTLVARSQTLTPSAWFRGTDFNLHPAQSIKPAFVHLPPPAALADEITPEIRALARGLENDPVRIFA
jgi:hypothetical protein